MSLRPQYIRANVFSGQFEVYSPGRPGLTTPLLITLLRKVGGLRGSDGRYNVFGYLGLYRMDAAGSTDPENNWNQDNSFPSDSNESEYDFFTNLKLLDEDHEWIESDEDVVLCRSCSAHAPSSNTGLCNPTAHHQNDEFKSFLEKRGTSKELEAIVSNVLQKLLQDRKTDGSSMFIIPKHDNKSAREEEKPLIVDKATPVSQLNVMTNEFFTANACPSPLLEDAFPMIHGLHPDSSDYQSTGNTAEIHERPALRMEQQERLNKLVFDTHSGANEEYLNPKRINKKKLGQSVRCKGWYPPMNKGSGPTSLSEILQAALSSLNRQIEMEIYLSQQLGIIVTPASLHRDRLAQK
ncbi:uncharacterized protein LOC105014535 isoform X1 [Esox lucius]|uniref:uncharacterized protein LOC105014535 isoform X1 n=2 Tax=Esox lucius TaxID=8010 RepID=UPI0014768F17|nr:uncharacterized protein LOC105014535 isoform X1 [Esox lucius]